MKIIYSTAYTFYRCAYKIKSLLNLKKIFFKCFNTLYSLHLTNKLINSKTDFLLEHSIFDEKNVKIVGISQFYVGSGFVFKLNGPATLQVYTPPVCTASTEKSSDWHIIL